MPKKSISICNVGQLVRFPFRLWQAFLRIQPWRLPPCRRAQESPSSCPPCTQTTPFFYDLQRTRKWWWFQSKSSLKFQSANSKLFRLFFKKLYLYIPITKIQLLCDIQSYLNIEYAVLIELYIFKKFQISYRPKNNKFKPIFLKEIKYKWCQNIYYAMCMIIILVYII